MSDENAVSIPDPELDAELQQMMEQEAKTKAATATATPEPEVPATPTPEPQVQAPVEPVREPVAPQAPSTNGDDPLKWADKKGLRTPEEIARAYQQLEQEFGRRNQAGHPGYQDLNNGNPAPQPPPPPQNWNPNPQMPAYGPPQGYGYPPPPPNRASVTAEMAKRYGVDAEDIERLMPMMVDAAEAIASRRTASLEQKLMNVERRTSRTDEVMRLSQDPAFLTDEVQSEIRKVFSSNPVLLQRPGGYEVAYNEAIKSLYRQKLQQGSPGTTNHNNPPVTAGGGNGSANTAPRKITPEVAATWTDDEFDAYMKSGGKVIPKR